MRLCGLTKGGEGFIRFEGFRGPWVDRGGVVGGEETGGVKVKRWVKIEKGKAMIVLLQTA